MIFRQFRSVACREYTLPRDDESSQPKGWIQGKHKNWTRARSHDQFVSTANMGLKSESGLWVKIILSLGSEYLMEQTGA